MLSGKIIHTTGDEIPEWNQEECYNIFQTTNFSQKVIFYRKLRKNYLVTKIYIPQIDEKKIFENLITNNETHKSPIMIPPGYSFILQQENTLILTYYHEITICTFFYYLQLYNFLSPEKISNEEAIALFIDLKNLQNNSKRAYRNLKFMPWRILLTKEGMLKVISLPEYDNYQEETLNLLETNYFFQICYFLNSGDRKESQWWNKYPNLSQELIADIQTCLNSENSMTIEEENISKFLEKKKFSSREVSFKIYEYIIDHVPLVRTVQDHFFLIDILLLNDLDKYDFWDYYVKVPNLEPLTIALRNYLFGRWASLMMDEFRVYYDTARRIINKEHLSTTLLNAALYDAYACCEFVNHEYEKAEKSLQTALEIVIAINGKDSFLEAVIYSNLTHVNVRLLNNDKARQYTRWARDITLLQRKEDDIFFCVLNGNSMILTDNENVKQESFKKVIELKRKYWSHYHPNVLLSFYNFYYIAERAYGDYFEFNRYVEFELIKYKSHLEYYGDYHHSVLTSIQLICSTYLNTNDGAKMLAFLSKVQTEYKLAEILPIAEEFKSKLIRKIGSPQMDEYSKRQRAKVAYYQRFRRVLMPDYYPETQFGYLRSFRELLRNKVYLDDLTFT